MVSVGLLVTLEARPGKPDAVARFLDHAVALVQKSPKRSPGSPYAWGLRASRSSMHFPVKRGARPTLPDGLQLP